MRNILAGMALLVALPCWAQDNSGSHPPAPIVVTGNGLADSARQLEQCLARKCAPPEDIDASITLAENQLLAGDYRKARATLAAARDRNGGHRKDYPVEVADLERSYGRMTDLDGFPDRARIAQVDALDTLKGGLDGKDTRVLIQRLTAGDDFRLVGRTDAADETYRRVEKQAREAGEPQVAGIAMLRSAAMYTFLASQDSIFRSTARARIARIERTTEPELEQVRIAARVLRARLTGLAGSSDAMDRAIANLGNPASPNPCWSMRMCRFATAPRRRSASRSTPSPNGWISASGSLPMAASTTSRRSAAPPRFRRTGPTGCARPSPRGAMPRCACRRDLTGRSASSGSRSCSTRATQPART